MKPDGSSLKLILSSDTGLFTTQDLFALDDEDDERDERVASEYSDIDACLAAAQSHTQELLPIATLIRSQPQKKKRKVGDLKPILFVRFNTRTKSPPKPVTLRALVDSGATSSLIIAKHAKKLKIQKDSASKSVFTTPNGELTTSKCAKAQFTLPELHDNRLITWTFAITENLSSYDMIIGRDIMSDLQMDVKFSTNTIEWDGHEVPLKDSDASYPEAFHISDSVAVDDATARIKGILDAKYEAADLQDVCDTAEHLNKEQQQMLFSLLSKYEELFDGSLGTWTGSEVTLNMKPDITPYHARAFPIPRVHLETLKMEVNRLCEIGVLKRVNRSEWAAPTFIIPKKDGSVRFISDFRELNKRIRRQPFPIPKIQDMLLNLEGFQFATSLDLNMGYYHIELSPDSKKYCTIVLPFGKYEYQRLPMGLCNSPDIFQEKVSELMEGLDFVRAYIDDLLICSSASYHDHLEKLEEVLRRLQKAGLKVNAKKSFFAKGQLEYLGYWITRNGIQPVAKKVEAIANIAPPKTKRELRKFIGMVNYYRDMWIRRSHLLAPLAALTSKTAKWRWGTEEQNAFDQMKKVLSRETLLAYPDFNKKFVIHTDASHYQLGAVISQDGKPIAFYSRKLKPEQTRYTTTERELLSIVETLKEFRNILLGHQIVVHTDHKNLTCKHFNTERVLRWRLILEEYNPELLYIKGEDNIVADALSRLDLLEDKGPDGPSTEQPELAVMSELFAEDEEPDIDNFPLTHDRVEREQQRDEWLQEQFSKKPDLYRKEDHTIGRTTCSLITRNGKIVIPKTLQGPAVQFYHNILSHPGETRTELTLAQHYFFKGMRTLVQKHCKTCQACQLNKRQFQKYGKVPPKDPEVIPWKTLCIDLIGPYTIDAGDVKKKRQPIILHCLTMIDPATGWFEIVEIPKKTADVVANKLEHAWFTRYPWPQEVVMDRGVEFMREVKDVLLPYYGIKRKPITTRNPQANAMVERAHKTIHNMIRTQGLRKREDFADPDDPWTGILSAVGFAMRATVHTTTQATPTQLVFNRDAMHNVQFVADWQYIKDRKQKLIIQNNKRENSTRRDHEYKVNDLVKVQQDSNRKHGEDEFRGPYTVTKVNDNGTLELQRNTQRGGEVRQTWNIRQVMPYHV